MALAGGGAAEEHLLFVAQTLGISAASLVGPWRPFKCIYSGEQSDGYVTSHVLDLLRVLQIPSPAAAIVRDACAAQAQAVGSGVTSVAVLVGAMSEAAISLLRAGVPRHAVVCGFDEATELCEAVFDGAAQCCARGTMWALLSGLGRRRAASTELSRAGKTDSASDNALDTGTGGVAEEVSATDADDVSWFFADSSRPPVRTEAPLQPRTDASSPSPVTSAEARRVGHARCAALRLARGLQHQHDTNSDPSMPPTLSVAMQIAVALVKWTAPTIAATPRRGAGERGQWCDAPATGRSRGHGEMQKTSQFAACTGSDAHSRGDESPIGQQYGRHGSAWPVSRASDSARLPTTQSDDTLSRKQARSLRRWAQRLRDAAAAATQCSCSLQGFATSECCVVRGCLLQIHPHSIIDVRRALRQLRKVDMEPSVDAGAEVSGGTSSYVRTRELAGLVPELTRHIGCTCANSICARRRSPLCPAWGVAVVRGDCSWRCTMQGALSSGTDPRRDVQSINNARSAFRTQLVRVLSNARVSVLLVEGGASDCLSPLRVDCAAHNEVLVVTSVPLPQLEAIAAASGATIVGSVLAVEPSHVGRRPLRLALRSGGWERGEDARFVLPAASQAEYSSRLSNAAVNHLWIAPAGDDARDSSKAKNDTALTLFLAAPAVPLVHAVAHGLDTYVNRLCDTMEAGSVLPGGGAMELACNAVLRQHAAAVERHASHLVTRESALAACVHHEQHGQVLRAFAEALLAVPAALLRGLGTTLSNHSAAAVISGPLAVAMQGAPEGALSFTDAVACTVLERAVRSVEECSATSAEGFGFYDGMDRAWLSQWHLELARRTGREMGLTYAPPHEGASMSDDYNLRHSYAFDGVEARKQGLRRAAGAVEMLMCIDHVIVNQADEHNHAA